MFYTLTESSNPEIGTEFLQAQKMNSGYNYDLFNSTYAISEYRRRIVPFEPNLETIIVHERAKMTDMLSVAMLMGGGFVINERLKILFSNFNLCECQYFKCKLEHKKKIFDNYYYMHLISDFRKEVDFSQSVFYLPLKGYGEEKEMIFEGYKDYERFLCEFSHSNYLKSKKLTMKSSLRELDMFVIGDFNKLIHISQKLRDKLVEAKITGLEINESTLKIL